MDGVGDYRKGFVIQTNPPGEPEGSVEIEWSDGTREIFRPRPRPVGLPGRLAPCANASCPCHQQPKGG